ncbi:hypothetical protein LTR62_004322 [Meristemomyces frigidus]|uniref:RING-type domain-containing protein n=1 Tax=Meristemomyces frigidus TaxID=1508187 RepID=A0AAN7TI13_9PEZI|nr:hypothetical protein LTR62_004322 [Meristemomyces frigidus]
MSNFFADSFGATDNSDDSSSHPDSLEQDTVMSDTTPSTTPCPTPNASPPPANTRPTNTGRWFRPPGSWDIDSDARSDSNYPRAGTVAQAPASPSPCPDFPTSFMRHTAGQQTQMDTQPQAPLGLPGHGTAGLSAFDGGGAVTRAAARRSNAPAVTAEDDAMTPDQLPTNDTAPSRIPVRAQTARRGRPSLPTPMEAGHRMRIRSTPAQATQTEPRTLTAHDLMNAIGPFNDEWEQSLFHFTGSAENRDLRMHALRGPPPPPPPQAPAVPRSEPPRPPQGLPRDIIEQYAEHAYARQPNGRRNAIVSIDELPIDLQVMAWASYRDREESLAHAERRYHHRGNAHHDHHPWVAGNTLDRDIPTDIYEGVPAIRQGVDRNTLSTLATHPLATTDLAEDGTVSCPVCLEDVPVGEQVTSLVPSCAHWFHGQCVSEWLANNNTCPMCRTIVGGRAQGIPIRTPRLRTPEEREAARNHGMAPRRAGRGMATRSAARAGTLTTPTVAGAQEDEAMTASPETPHPPSGTPAEAAISLFRTAQHTPDDSRARIGALLTTETRLARSGARAVSAASTAVSPPTSASAAASGEQEGNVEGEREVEGEVEVSRRPVQTARRGRRRGPRYEAEPWV